jgi:hypothetical protein
MTHRWIGRSYLPERHGHRCRIVVKGRGRAALVEFEDGYRARTEVSLLRRLAR